MKIKKFVKIFGIVAIAFLLLLIIGIIVLNSFLKSEKGQKLIISKIETALNMPVETKNLRVSIFSGIQLDGFGIKNPQGFEEGYFLKTDSIILKYNFLALLRRQIKITEIKIIKPYIHLKQKSENQWNFPLMPVSITNENISTPDKQKKKPGMIPFSAEEIQIIEGNFVYEPLEENKKLIIHNFTLKAKIHSIELPPNLKINLSIDKINLSRAPIMEDITCSMNTRKGVAYLDKFLLNLFGGSLAIKGNTTIPVNEQDAEYDADISLKDIDLKSVIKQFLPEAESLLQGMLTANVNIKGTGLDAIADMKLTIPSLTVQDQVKINQFKSDIHYDAPNFTIKNLNMNVFGGSVEGKGTGSLEDFRNPVFDVNLNINNIDVETALDALGQDSSLAQGKVAGNVNLAGSINNIRANGKISSPRLNLKKMGQVTDIRAPFRATITEQTKEIKVESFSAKIYGGSIGGKANITFGKAGEPRFSTTLNLSGLEAGYALKELAGKAFLTGKTEGNIHLAGKGRNINALTGSTNIIFKNGKIATHPIQNLLAVFIPSLKTINFVAARFLSNIGSGKVNIKAATLENPNLLTYYGKGQIKLSNQKLAIPSHLSMRCNLVEKMPLISGAFAKEDNNWCGIDFNIFGTLTKPQTDLEERLAQQAIGDVIEQIFDKDKEEKKDRGGIEDIFEGIFK
jgi:uncharacterized protein involved in outer membrane biogenesis